MSIPTSADDSAAFRADILAYIGKSARSIISDSRTPTTKMINTSISCLEQAIALIPDTDPVKAERWHDLAKAYRERFEMLGQEEDITKAITALRKALEIAPSGKSKNITFFNDLTNAYRLRFEHNDCGEEIRNGLLASDEALLLCPPSDEQFLTVLTSRGSLLLRAFELSGNMKDLNAGISVLEDAVQPTPLDSDNLPHRLHNLSNLYSTRFDHLNDRQSLKNAISASERALDKTPSTSSTRFLFLQSLSAFHLARFEQDSDAADLENSILLAEQAVQLSPQGRPEQIYSLTSLGYSLLRRFEYSGNLVDIDNSISALKRADSLLAQGRSKAMCVNSLGQASLLRFARLSNFADLDTSISSFQAAISLTPDTDVAKPAYLNNLSGAFQTRFTRLWQKADIDNSISSLHQAIRLLADDHPFKPGFLSNLGDSYLKRYNRLRGIEDLNLSIQANKQAVALTPENHTRKPIRLLHLGKAYLKRFEDHTKERAHLKEAMWTLYEAVNLTPDGHPFKVDCLTWLGICTRNFFDVFRMVDGLDKAINSYKRAATSPSGEPALRYAAGMLWAHAARIRHGPSQQAIDAYSVALDLLPRIAWLGSDIASRHKELANKGDDAPKAAVAAIEMGEYGTALEWLEQGRSVVWGQLLQLRSPVDHLRSVNETLADELLRVSRELDGISTRQTQTSGSKQVKEDGLQSLEEVAQRHRRLAEEWEELVGKVRSLPGFETFLRPKKLAELRKAAREGPVVFLNIHHLQCDALIIQSDQESDPILHVPLSSFSIKKAQELQLSLKRLLGLSGVRVRGGHQVRFLPGQQGPSFEKILSTLWMEIVKPVLDKLNYKVSSSSTPPRIWWCATGPVAFLPLHAAGLYTTPQEGTKVFKYVTSSYTPTLTALLGDPPKKDSQFHGILAISQPTTPNQSPLPKTENEVERIRQHCISTGQPLEWLNKSETTISNVLQGMMNHNWVHLACHAVQRVDAPTQSAFCLHQGRLELSEIIARCKSLPLAELAFLSACQTASGDEKLSEEAVHLAAGMMLAGYKSVVATMWSIRDRDAPLVADGVYRQLLCRLETGSTMREERPDSTRSAHALHCAVRELREVVGEKAFVAWVPFIHFGL